MSFFQDFELLFEDIVIEIEDKRMSFVKKVACTVLKPIWLGKALQDNHKSVGVTLECWLSRIMYGKM